MGGERINKSLLEWASACIEAKEAANKKSLSSFSVRGTRTDISRDKSLNLFHISPLGLVIGREQLAASKPVFASSLFLLKEIDCALCSGKQITRLAPATNTAPQPDISRKLVVQSENIFTCDWPRQMLEKRRPESALGQSSSAATARLPFGLAPFHVRLRLTPPAKQFRCSESNLLEPLRSNCKIYICLVILWLMTNICHKFDNSSVKCVILKILFCFKNFKKYYKI